MMKVVVRNAADEFIEVGEAKLDEENHKILRLDMDALHKVIEGYDERDLYLFGRIEGEN